MTFVFSPWYFVLILLVAAIVASIIVFIRMDKTDRKIIDKFVKESGKGAIVNEIESAEQTIEEKKE